VAEKLPPQAAPAPQPGDEDLAILHPERTLEIAGREITVREYGFITGLRLRPLMQPILDDLHRLVTAGQSADLGAIMALLGTHWEATLALAAEAAEVERDWIDSLDPQQGELLLTVWWSVCGPFFWRNVLGRVAAERLAQAQAAPGRAGPTSTSASSPPAADPSSASAA
jgi:hypothetical protein